MRRYRVKKTCQNYGRWYPEGEIVELPDDQPVVRWLEPLDPIPAEVAESPVAEPEPDAPLIQPVPQETQVKKAPVRKTGGKRK